MKPTFSAWVPPQKATIGNPMSGNAKSCQGTKGAGIKGRGTKSKSPWGILGGLLIWFLHSQLCNERFGRSNASGLQQVSGSQANPTSRAALVQMKLELQDGPILKWSLYTQYEQSTLALAHCQENQLQLRKSSATCQKFVQFIMNIRSCKADTRSQSWNEPENLGTTSPQS